MGSVDRAPADLLAVRSAYDVVAADYATHLPDTRAESPLDLAMVDAFIEAVTRDGGGRVVDAGCGAGRMSRYLADRQCQVTGVDLSSEMARMARRDHADLTFAVGALADLPYADDEFAGVLAWYSVIHTPPNDLGTVFSEIARILRPGGHVLVGFQVGSGVRDVSAAYRRFGHEVTLERHLHDPDHVASELAVVGLAEEARMVRRPEGSEVDDQAVILAGATAPTDGAD